MCMCVCVCVCVCVCARACVCVCLCVRFKSRYSQIFDNNKSLLVIVIMTVGVLVFADERVLCYEGSEG